jgi:predicted ATPase/DNA-binding CsgD family transcriptional regulator
MLHDAGERMDDRRSGPAGVPAPVTSFVGRSRQLARIDEMFGSARLVTLVGPGGSGKTRLALEFASRLVVAPVHVVDLAPIVDADLIPPAIAAALGVRSEPGASVRDTLAERFGDGDMILVLDNLEQLPEAGPLVAEMLARSAGLRVLATSRAPLHVRGEHEFPVGSLELPGAATASLGDLAAVEAVQLFVARATAIQPEFRLTDENARTVAAICERVDGLPLAIELAAVRTKLFSPDALLDRLDRRLGTLTGGPADVPERQRTLRDTIAWSFDLLHEHDRSVFAALAVFTGGCTVEAAEAVVSEPTLLPVMERLAGQSVLTVRRGSDGEPRFGMLETIREFAWEQVTQADRVGVRDRHLAYFVGLAERSQDRLRGPDQARWIRRLAEEQANIRAALAWAQEAHREESLLRLAASLRRRFWYEAGGLVEGRRWLEAAIALDAEVAPSLRANALQRLAWIVGEMGDGESEDELFEASLAAAEDDDHLVRFEALIGLSYRALGSGDPSLLRVAEERMQEAVEQARRADTPGALVEPLLALGHLATAQGDLVRASRCFEDALETARRVGDVWGVAGSLFQLGTVALVTGAAERAASLLEESAALSTQSGDREARSHALAAHAGALTVLGDLETARSRLLEAASVVHEIAHPLGRMLVLEAAAAWLEGAHLEAAAVEAWSSAETYRAGHRWPEMPDAVEGRERSWSRAQTVLGTVTFEVRWAEGAGRRLPEAMDQAIETIGSVDVDDLTPDETPSPDRHGLTPREREVLALVASGMTDGQIADALFISKKTASVHIANIKAKLGASSRVEVATMALGER